jgi:hypothetical protein
MGSFATLKRQLLAAVGEKLRQFGFVTPTNRGFYRQIPVGRATFHLAFIQHQDDFDVTADIAVRFDDVEEVVNEGNKLLTDKERKGTHTIGAELGNIADGHQKRWTVASTDDVSLVATSIADAFVNVALPYADTYADRRRALEVLSGDGPESWLHCPFHDHRATTAVALALLCDGDQAARSLAKRKLSYLEQREDPGIASFRAFLDRVGLCEEPAS